MSKEADLMFDDDGDLVLGSYHENEIINFSFLSEADERDTFCQIIKNRVKTTKPDWFYDNTGANLETILGMENSKETAMNGAALIADTLTSDGFLKEEDIYIRPIPTSTFTIMYGMAVKVSEYETIEFKISVALNAGINIEEVM